MKKLLEWVFDIFLRNSQEKFQEIEEHDDSNKDELLGFWEENIDDPTGFRTMVWSCGIEFLEHGKAISHAWYNEIPTEERKIPLEWKRISEKSIAIRFITNDEENEQWDILEYEILNYDGWNGHSYNMLVEKGKNEFWICVAPIYKRQLYKKTQPISELCF